MIAAAFYCASSDLYFPGAVAMVNSLRLHGHEEPIFLLDCGLTDSHRELLGGEATIVAQPSDVSPHLLKTVAPTLHPAQTMVLIDVDMIVTRSLGPLIDEAEAGRVVAFANDRDRFVPEWGELLDLGPVERRPYVSSGLVALGGEIGAEVLRLWDDRQHRVDYEQSWFARDVADYPFRFIDQDVLNAVLGATAAADELVVLDQRLAPTPPFDRVRLIDRDAVRCALTDGSQPYILHHFDRKPWVARMRSNIYSRLLTRLLLGPGVAVPYDPSELPVQLRTGAAASVGRLSTDLLMSPAGLARRIRERRRGLASVAEGTPP